MLIAATAVHHLPGVLHLVEPTLNKYGYLAVFGLVLLEDFGVPVPAEPVLVLSAVYAGTGRLNIVLVVLLGFCGAVIGDNIGFAIGHFGGRTLVDRYGRYVFLTPERMDKATGFFERQGAKVIVIARFIEGLRQANGIIAGISGMRWVRFLAFNALGAALWVGLWSTVGYLSGNHIDTIYSDITHYITYVAIAIGVLIVAWIVRRVLKARARRPESESSETSSSDVVQASSETPIALLAQASSKTPIGRAGPASSETPTGVSEQQDPDTPSD